MLSVVPYIASPPTKIRSSRGSKRAGAGPRQPRATGHAEDDPAGPPPSSVALLAHGEDQKQTGSKETGISIGPVRRTTKGRRSAPRAPGGIPTRDMQTERTLNCFVDTQDFSFSPSISSGLIIQPDDYSLIVGAIGPMTDRLRSQSDPYRPSAAARRPQVMGGAYDMCPSRRIPPPSTTPAFGTVASAAPNALLPVLCMCSWSCLCSSIFVFFFITQTALAAV